jgi:hypothetical protein
MTMVEIVSEISASLGLPAHRNIEQVQIETMVNKAFRELKRYMRTPVDKTVPFSTRVKLSANGIFTKKILYCFAARPRIGLTLGSIESGNAFQVAAAVNTQGMVGQTNRLNLDPIMTEVSMAQVRNTLSTDFQWHPDLLNDCVYCTHRDPKPSMVTIRYVPIFNDVSEIISDTWLDYLIRMSEAFVKKAWGQAKSKYTIEGSNVSLNGDQLLTEANAELEAIRQELGEKKSKFVVMT